MRRGKDARIYYACGNHMVKRPVHLAGGAQGICPMLPVFEQDVKNAFATTLNRLAAEPSILASHDTGKEDAEEKISLEAKLESVKRRKSLLHDRALAERYTAGLREKKAALDMEEKEITDRLEQLERKSPVAEIKRAVNRCGVQEAFTESDEKLFKRFVDHAVLWSKEKARFYLTCGLVLEEDMHIVKEGKTYIDLPVRTVFEENTTL